MVDKILKKYGIEETTKTPFKFLGGPISYGGDDVIVNYNGHFQKVDLIPVPDSVRTGQDKEQRVYKETHLKYRQAIGVLNY